MSFESVPKMGEFLAAYNDADGFPTIADVAKKLGLSRKSVINRAATHRQLLSGGMSLPKIITRPREKVEQEAVEAEPELTPQDHAMARAKRLSAEITALLQRSNYPVINPEAIIVDSYLSERYDRDSGAYELVEGTPRTWISDTLRVAPIKDCRNRKFLFSGAQNDAPIHEGFWQNLQAYATAIGAEIVVGPWTYETQWWSENNPISRSYANELTPHLCFGQFAVGDNFVFCGEMNTLPTAAEPLSDLKTYSRGRWAVFPHAKLQLLSIPSTDPAVQAHQVMTTGAVTKPKVIARKAGSKSIFHHVIGATLVEFDVDGDIFCRQINASEDGSFYDLNVLVKDGEVFTDQRVRAIVYGDLHFAKLNPVNARGSFGVDIRDGSSVPGSMLEVLGPEEIIIHDGHDQEKGNHHTIGDGHFSFRMALRGRTSVKDEVTGLGSFYRRLWDRLPGVKIVAVESNHDLALNRYIKEGRYRNDGVNVKFGLELEHAMIENEEKVAAALDAYKELPKFSLLEWAMRKIFGRALDHVHWAYDGYSYLVDDIECGHHGFRGANGAQGSVRGYAQMGRKMSIGDKHVPAIFNGVYCAGAQELRHLYNVGPSGWAVANIVHYPNGKRAIITLQNGKWRA